MFQIKLILCEAQNIKFWLTSRNHAYCILKTFHVAHPKYYFRKYLSFCCFLNDSESTEKTILVFLCWRIINNFCNCKYSAAQVQISRRPKAFLISFSQVDFFYLKKIVAGFSLAHYFNCLFKYTQIAVWAQVYRQSYSGSTIVSDASLIVWQWCPTLNGSGNFTS